MARALALAGLAAAVGACGGSGGGGGGGGGQFGELLFVSDGLSVTSYSVSGGSPTARDTALIPGIPGTYSRSGTVVTVTMQKHTVPDGASVLLDFSAGTGGTATDGTYVADFVDVDTFTVVDSVAGSITGGEVLRSPSVSLGATYAQGGLVVTITLPNHGLAGDDTVTLDYTSGAAVDDDTRIATVLDANTFTVTADAAATTSGNVTVIVGANYTVFGMAMHPDGRWLYVTSAYDCSNGAPYCWGGDLVSRFAIDWDTGALAFEESFRTTDDPSVVTARPSPVTLSFSPDGTRLFHQDDDLDGLRMWSVDPVDGGLALIAATAPNTTFRHGVGVSADGTRVYNGARVFVVGPASLTPIPGGAGGEANQVLGSTMFAIMGLGNNAQLRVFSLANPDLPVQVATTTDTPHRARDFALASGGSLIVSSGFGGLKSYDFDGAAITPSVGAGDTELRDGGLPFPTPAAPVARVYRTVSLNEAETLAASAYFTNDEDAGTGGVPPSGFVLVNVAADGSLSLAGDFPTATYARVARFFQRP